MNEGSDRDSSQVWVIGVQCLKFHCLAKSVKRKAPPKAGAKQRSAKPFFALHRGNNPFTHPREMSLDD